MRTRIQLTVTIVLMAALVFLIVHGLSKTQFGTSVTELLPEGDIESEILHEIAEQEQGRQITVRLHVESGVIRSESTTTFIKSLESSPAIEKVWIAGPEAFEETARTLFDNRYFWLMPSWLNIYYPDWKDNPPADAGNIATLIVEELESYLQKPESFTLSDTIPRDPFLLMRSLTEMSDMLSTQAAENEQYLWVQQTDSPFSKTGQEPVFEALEIALDSARVHQGGLEMEYSGVSVFAHASKAGIKGEIQRLNLYGLLFVFALTLFAVRTFHAVFRIFLVIVLAILAACAAVITIFPSVHVISLVIGSILTGVAVDYAFHLILFESTELHKRAVRRVVIAGSISSALGFLVLVWAPLPFLREVGVFVGCGLVMALLSSLFLCPEKSFSGPYQKWKINPFYLPKWLGPVVLLALLPGLIRLEWNDTIRDLEFPLPEIKETDIRLRNQSSVFESSGLFLLFANDIITARGQLNDLIDMDTNLDFIHAGNWIPTYQEALMAQKLFQQIGGMPRQIKDELNRREFLPEAFSSFFDDWNLYTEYSYSENLYRDEISQLAQSLPGPLGNMIHVGDNLSWIMVLTPGDFSPPDVPGLIVLDQAEMLSDSFSGYRKTILAFSGYCLTALFIGLALAFGITRGVLSLLIPTVAVLAGNGLIGYLHGSLGLFHVVGTLLAFCISLDYSLFAVEFHRNRARIPGSFVISIISTLGIFGILALSQIPAVHQLAITVVIIISTSLLLILAGWPFIHAPAVPGNQAFRLLPHGRQAILIGRILQIGERSIRAECTANKDRPIPCECLLEAMAQSAALLLVQLNPAEKEPREGMLVVVQSSHQFVDTVPNGEPCEIQVELLSENRPGLLMFKGTAQGSGKRALQDTSFSIFIPSTI